jgi:tetratricopeptide (TPR) repeat protein
MVQLELPLPDRVHPKLAQLRVESANKALALDPGHPHAREHLAGAYWKKGDFARQIQEDIKHAELHGEPVEALQHLKRVFEQGGRAGVVRLVLERAASHPQAFPAMQLAIFYGEAGDLDNAFLHLDRALEAAIRRWFISRSRPNGMSCAAIRGSRSA